MKIVNLIQCVKVMTKGKIIETHAKMSFIFGMFKFFYVIFIIREMVT